MRRAAAAVVVLAVAIAPSSARAEHGTQAAKQAAADIQAARDLANSASQAMFDAESDIDGLTLDIRSAEVELVELETQASAMQQGLEDQAVRNYMGAGNGGGFVLFTDLSEINDGLTADVMSAISREAALVDLDDYDALMDDVTDARAALDADREEAEQAALDLGDLKAAAEREIEALAQMEAERLVSEEVEHELERERERTAERVGDEEVCVGVRVVAEGQHTKDCFFLGEKDQVEKEIIILLSKVEFVSCIFGGA
jgi:hypothetical protein